MGIYTQFLIATLSLLFFISKVESAQDNLKCIVCQDCPESPGDMSQECKRNQDRCIKMELMNGHIDRACGDVKRCAGREGGRKSRSAEEFTNDTPKHRTIRQLLGSASNPAGATDDGTKEIASMWCCSGEDCNGSIRSTVVSIFSATFLLPLLFHLILNF